MAYRWIFRDTPKTVSGTSHEFESQQAAEDWMGTEWRRLLEEGHLAASLMNGEDEIYTMKLTAE